MYITRRAIKSDKVFNRKLNELKNLGNYQRETLIPPPPPREENIFLPITPLMNASPISAYAIETLFAFNFFH